MLAVMLGSVATFCASCAVADTLAVVPAERAPEVTLAQFTDGWTRFALRVDDGVARLEELTTTGCISDGLQLLADSQPIYDAATGVLRVPVTLRNNGPASIVAPVRLRFVADSAQFVNAQGQVIAGTPNIEAINYDSVHANGRNGIWRFDTLLAASGQPQVRAANATTRRKWLEFSGTTWSQRIRIKLPMGAAVQSSAVPPIPPDSIPAFVSDSANLVRPSPGGGFPFVRDLLSVEFTPSSTTAQREGALSAVGGIVVGGLRSGTSTGGLYLVKIPTSSDSFAVASAEIVLRNLAVVRQARRFIIGPMGVSYQRPSDGSSWLLADWITQPTNVLAPSPHRSNWGAIAVRAPWAWGCTTGTSAVGIGVVDIGFSMAATPDVNANVVRARFDNLPNDPDARHGNWVTSVPAARGNNGIGMAGLMWQASLDIVDPTLLAPSGSPSFVGGIRQIPYDRVVVETLRLARDGARIINISLGASATPLFALSDTAQNRQAREVVGFLTSGLAMEGLAPLLVVPSGNVPAGDPRESIWPLLLDSAGATTLVVGASRRNETLLTAAPGSAYISVVAPGDSVGVHSLGVNSIQSGASFAAPQPTRAPSRIVTSRGRRPRSRSVASSRSSRSRAATCRPEPLAAERSRPAWAAP